MAIETPTLRDLLDRLVSEVESLRDRVATLEALQPAKVIYNAPDNTQEECETHQCSYFDFYLAQGPADLTHEGYHAAERQCKEAHDRLERWFDEHRDDNATLPRYMEESCRRLEERVRA